MGTVGDCFDNSVAEAFFSGLQRELLDQHHWPTREEARGGDLRLDRVLVQPPPAALHTGGLSPPTTKPPTPLRSRSRHDPTKPAPQIPPKRLEQLTCGINLPGHSAPQPT